MKDFLSFGGHVNRMGSAIGRVFFALDESNPFQIIKNLDHGGPVDANTPSNLVLGKGTFLLQSRKNPVMLGGQTQGTHAFLIGFPCFLRGFA